MNIDVFTRLRPFLYHLTASSNLPRIERAGRLESAARLYSAAGMNDRVVRRRGDHDSVIVENERIHIRDQKPLHAANIDLTAETFEQVVAMLNRYVYFWPGDERCPIPPGRNHF